MQGWEYCRVVERGLGARVQFMTGSGQRTVEIVRDSDERDTARDAVASRISQLGDAGWELVNVDQQYGAVVWYFKRPKPK